MGPAQPQGVEVPPAPATPPPPVVAHALSAPQDTVTPIFQAGPTHLADELVPQAVPSFELERHDLTVQLINANLAHAETVEQHEALTSDLKERHERELDSLRQQLSYMSGRLQDEQDKATAIVRDHKHNVLDAAEARKKHINKYRPEKMRLRSRSRSSKKHIRLN